MLTAVLTWVQLANPGWLIIDASYAVIYVWCDISVEDQRRKELYRIIGEKNDELKVTAEKAEQAAQAKTEFLSRMNNDIRTPMNAIIGLIHLAKKEYDLQTVRGYLDKIETSSKFLLGLINDILDMSKIENGDMTLNEAPFTCGDFSDSILTVIKPLIDKRDINFVFRMGGTLAVSWWIVCGSVRYSSTCFRMRLNSLRREGPRVRFRADRAKGNRRPRKDRTAVLRPRHGYRHERGIPEAHVRPVHAGALRARDKARGTGLGLPS